MWREKINPEENEIALWVSAKWGYGLSSEKRERRTKGKSSHSLNHLWQLTLPLPQPRFPSTVALWPPNVYSAESHLPKSLDGATKRSTCLLQVWEIWRRPPLVSIPTGFAPCHAHLWNANVKTSYNFFTALAIDSPCCLDFVRTIRYQHSRLLCFSYLLDYSLSSVLWIRVSNSLTTLRFCLEKQVWVPLTGAQEHIFTAVWKPSFEGQWRDENDSFSDPLILHVLLIRVGIRGRVTPTAHEDGLLNKDIQGFYNPSLCSTQPACSESVPCWTVPQGEPQLARALSLFLSLCLSLISSSVWWECLTFLFKSSLTLFL